MRNAIRNTAVIFAIFVLFNTSHSVPTRTICNLGSNRLTPSFIFHLDEPSGTVMYNNVTGDPSNSTSGTYTRVAGKQGKCLSFTYSSGELYIGSNDNDVSLSGSAISFGFWYKCNNTITSKGGYYDVGTGLMALNGNDAGTGFRSYLDRGGGWQDFNFSIAANTWYFLVTTYDGSYRKNYVNGACTLQNLETTGGAIGAGASNARIYSGGVGGGAVTENYDEFFGYEICLTSAQVRDMYYRNPRVQ